MDFASVLAQRMQAVVPEGFTVRAEDGEVRVRYGDNDLYGAGTQVEHAEGNSAEVRTSAAWSALSSVQDYVSEGLREPWPSGPSKGSRRQFFLPEVVVEGSMLRMWFGERTSPALTLDDIDLTETQ